MVDTSNEIDFDNNDQVRLLTNLRQDIKTLLIAHPKGIWFRMLPKVFYMQFNRDIHFDLFAITNSFLFLDYILDLIQFDLPDNIDEDDFIIELKHNNDDDDRLNLPIKDLKSQRNVLFELLQKASLEERGSILREICIIDEQLKDTNDNELTSMIPLKKPTHEQVALRFQKIRSMIDFSLQYLIKTSQDISENDLVELFQNSDEFITNLTPLTQRLSLLSN